MKISKKKLEIEMARQCISNNQELAELSGISRQTISYISNGKSCSPMILGKIAKGLKVEPEQIIED